MNVRCFELKTALASMQNEEALIASSIAKLAEIRKLQDALLTVLAICRDESTDSDEHRRQNLLTIEAVVSNFVN